MNATTAAEAFSKATAALVADEDIQDVLLRTMIDCRSLLEVDLAGVLLFVPGSAMELLGATSHLADELELLQIQEDDGPCREVIRTGAPVAADTPGAIAGRWGTTGPAIVAAGVHLVRAYPMRWHGRVLGGLNLFRTFPTVTPPDDAVGQAFADLASLLLMRHLDASDAEVAQLLHGAVAGRAVIEQAKGVIAHQGGIEIDDAFVELRKFAEEKGMPVTAAALEVVRRAGAGDA